MKSALIAAIVAAVIAAGTASAATAWINGRNIRPYSIPLNRLVSQPVGTQGPAGPAGPTGATGPQGEKGATENLGVGFLCVAPDNTVTWDNQPLLPFGSSCPTGDLLIKVATYTS